MASAQPLRFEREQRIAEAIQALEVTGLSFWADLDALSTHTSIEQIEVPAEGVVIGPGNRFSAVMNVYVTLQYGNNDEEGFTTSDSFLAKLSGTLNGDNPVVESSSVDTTAFYE